MKTILAVCLGLLLASQSVYAVNDVPPVVNYQGKLLNSSGNPATDGNYTITFKLYSAASAGALLWGSTYPVIVAGGNFNVVLGEGGSAVSGAQSTDILIALGNTSTPYLGITVLTDSSGNTINNAQEITPRLRFLSSPYAVVAQNAKHADSADSASNADRLGNLLPNQFLQPANTAPYTMNGPLTVPSLTVNGPSTQNGKSTVTGDVAISGTLSATSTSGGGFVPVGGIIMWSGSVTAVPAGWALCDGNGGTPDLRDRFVIGAGTTYKVGDKGGRASVTLGTNNIPAHQHTFKDTIFGTYDIRVPKRSPDGLDTGVDQGNDYTGSASGTDNDNNLSWVRRKSDSALGNSTGGTDSFDIRPPYYALAFIMRVQ
jgi:microcystin-dependent protein